MGDKIISITLWGNTAKKGKWIDWYKDTKKIANNMGYELTHIGIQNQSFSDGKIRTVSRMEKKILESIEKGDCPQDFSCFVLPSDFRSASFDYTLLFDRTENDISILISENDYEKFDENELLNTFKQYIDYECGEMYEVSRKEMPLIYAATRRSDYVKSYKHIKDL